MATETPEFLHEDEVVRAVGMGDRATADAKRMAFGRLWRRAQRLRAEKGLPPLPRARFGRRRVYPADTIKLLLDSLVEV